MAISVNWYDDEQTIAYVQFTPGWTWDDFWVMNQAFNQLAQTVDYPIALIVDMSNAGMPAQFVPELSKIAQTSEQRPAHLAFTVVVGLGVMLETVVNIFTRLYRRATAHVQFVSTVDEAVELIHRRHQATDS